MRSLPETRVIQLADRRDLAWMEVGDPGGTPVIALHGSPGRGTDFAVYHATALKCGVRVIGVDRPGYGHSAYHPRRSLSDWPDDVSQLAYHLGLERFGVIGHSAGGPHALACARFLSRRLLGCGVLSGLHRRPAHRSLRGCFSLTASRQPFTAIGRPTSTGLLLAWASWQSRLWLQCCGTHDDIPNVR